MGNTPKEIIEKRREQVQSFYFVYGKTQKEIAKVLGWDENTIWSDIQHIRLNWKEKAEKSGDEPLLKYIQRKEVLIKKAMESLSKAATDRNQQGWIRTIMELDKDLLEKLMDVGLVRRAPKEQINYNLDALKNFIVEVKQEEVKK